MGSLSLREIMTHSEKNSMTSSNLKFLPLFSLSNPPKKVTFHIEGDEEVLPKKGKEWRKERVMINYRQSQKRYMVSGSPCPLISFINVSYSVSFVVRGQRPRRGR